LIYDVAAPVPLPQGSRIGPYEIVSSLGAGGMGEVYRARDTRLNRDVAVKVLPAAVANDPDRRARFEREAQAVAALSHPNILAIFDAGVSDGTAYAVTELLDGATLRESLRTPLPVRKAIDIAIQIARGLAAAHDKGIVHRDLKPENVFLLGDGQVKILDFGLAKTTTETRGPDSETVAGTDPGTVLGTVGYMAPEQVRAQPVDGRSDLFSLGAILYEMLSGRRAFHRDTTAETMTAILKEDPPDLAVARADLPPALDSIVRHCLERNPAERFQSARDLVFNLQGQSSPSGSGSGSVAAARDRVRARVGAREITAWALVLVAGAIAAFFSLRSETFTQSSLGAARFQVLAPDKTQWSSPLGAPEGNNSGTISPDGRTLAFVVLDATGKSLLWLRPLDTFNARPVPGTEGAAFPFWSPDSRSIGFFTQTRLRKVSVDGGPVQTVAELSSTVRGGSWNSRGDIIFATAGSTILRVSHDGGPTRIVTKPDAENSAHQWPSFLPDGEHFLYYAAASRSVFLASLTAGTIKRLFGADTNATFAPPGDILFVREGALFAQRFDVARAELTGEAVAVVEQVSWTFAPWNLGAFSVSSTGVLTYRRGGGARTQFAWFDRRGRILSTIGPPGDYFSPTLSPDETKAAFGRRDDQSAGDIWTMDMARQTLSRFTFDPTSEIYPLWSPDDRLVYVSTRDGILMKNADGTGAARHVFGTAASLIPVQITQTPRQLLFFADLGGSTGFDIYVLPLDASGPGAKPTPVIQTPVTDVEPRFSPDGKWIAYASTETGGYNVFVQPHPATGQRAQVSTGGGRQPQWSPDGKELFFVTNDRKFYAVEVRAGATFEHGEPKLLFEMPSNTISVRNSYIPSKDGQRFLVNMLLDTAVPPIYVDTDWASTVKR
jgi:Tol biopolymer transport system component